MSSDFQAEVTCVLLCGFTRDIAGSLARPPRDPTLSTAAKTQPVSSVSLIAMAENMKSTLDQFYENLNRVKDFSESSGPEASEQEASTQWGQHRPDTGV